LSTLFSLNLDYLYIFMSLLFNEKKKNFKEFKEK